MLSLIRMIQSQARRQAALSKLQAMDSRQLADMGLSRIDLQNRF